MPTWSMGLKWVAHGQCYICPSTGVYAITVNRVHYASYCQTCIANCETKWETVWLKFALINTVELTHDHTEEDSKEESSSSDDDGNEGDEHVDDNTSALATSSSDADFGTSTSNHSGGGSDADCDRSAD